MFQIRKNPFPRICLTLLAFLMISSVTARQVQACTFVSMAKNGLVLVGYNEDYIDLRTALWFFPAGDKTYGRVFWGYDRPLFPYQGGMNEKGLFKVLQLDPAGRNAPVARMRMAELQSN